MMTVSDLTEGEFRSRNRIDDARWRKAEIEWPALQAIGVDFERRRTELASTADYYATLLQNHPGVHSVRWRVKDTEHLLEKIVRKRADSQEKYRDIRLENYTSIVTDLIGLRALHLLKADWETVHQGIVDEWPLYEPPVANIRDGDPTDLFTKHNCATRIHEHGYRSVHYVIRSWPRKTELLAEIQVRTLFEEGWSEINHRVRYPNHSDNVLLSLFISTFNRIAGSADELGGLMVSLASLLDETEALHDRAQHAVAEQINTIDQLVGELSSEKEKTTQQEERLAALTKEVHELRSRVQVADSLPQRGNQVRYDFSASRDAGAEAILSVADVASRLRHVSSIANAIKAAAAQVEAGGPKLQRIDGVKGV